MAEHRDAELAGLDRQELLEHYARAVQQASRDALTGLLNRGALEREIEKRLRGKPKQESCALFIIDLDNFKSVNDNLGHQTGDEVLKKAAALLSGLFRATDIVGRLGGDEFVVFLSGALTEEMVRDKAQKICDQALFLMGEAADLAVTASVGVHLSMDGEITFQTLYRSADLALYHAKRDGKQRYHLKMDAHTVQQTSVSEARPVSAVRLRTLLNHLDTGVAVLSVQRPIRFLYANARMARMLGREGEALTEDLAMESIHPEDREDLERVLRERVLGRNETVSLVVRVLHKNQQTMWWRIHAVQMEIEEQRRTILITAVDVSDLKSHEGITAPEQSGVWELDLNTRQFRLVTGKETFGCQGEEVDFPEGLLERGWIDRDSADAFREFAQEIYNGRSEGYANFKILIDAPGRYAWASFTYRTVYDGEGKPTWVAGMIERIASSAWTRTDLNKETALPPELMSCLILQARGNLTRDTLESCWREGKEELGKPDRLRCTDLLEQENSRRYPAVKLRTLPNLTRDSLLMLYQEEKNGWWVYEYHRADASGRVHRVSCVINLYPDPESGDGMMSIWINRMDARYNWEHALSVAIYKDPISKLYTCSTARELAVELLKERAEKQCALVLVDIGGLPRLYAQDSERMEHKWRALMAALNLAMGTDCVPGQVRANAFSFFYPEVPSEDALRRRLDRALVFLRGVLSDLVDCGVLRFLFCGVCRPQNQTSYNHLMRKAQALCSSWANTSSDRVDFAEDDSQTLRPVLAKSSQADKIRVAQQPESDRPLSEREQAAANACFIAMFHAASLADTARCVLRALGEYYEADRVYFLDLVENGEIVTMPAEWTGGDKKSIQEAISGAPASTFPLVEQCAHKRRPIFLSRSIQPANAEQLWRFAIFPVWDGERICSFLCVENARNVISDGALVLLLTDCLMQQARKFFQPPGYTVRGNRVEGDDLPDYRAFLQVIYTYTSEVYNSLGVVCVDVPRLNAIRGAKGEAYGQKLLWYITQTMTDIFGRAMVYRTWNAEYVALCPNVSRSTFFGNRARVRGLLAQRYAGEFRIGSAWADKVFNGKAMVEDARVSMQCDLPSQSG